MAAYELPPVPVWHCRIRMQLLHHPQRPKKRQHKNLDNYAPIPYTVNNKIRDAGGGLCAKSRVFCCPPRLWSAMRNSAGFFLQK